MATMNTDRTPQDDLRGAVVFTLLVLSAGWLVMAPLWFLVDGQPVYMSDADAGGSDTGFVLLLQVFPSVMMLTPALSAWITMRWVHGIRFRTMLTDLGLGTAAGTRRHPFVSLLLWSVLAIAGTIGLVIASVAVAALLGFLALDWSIPALAPAAEATGIPVGLLLALQLVSVPVAAVVPNAFFAAGEEIGWRGYLLPRLRRLWGTPVAVIVSGIVWGAWHAPIILLGYNFSRPHIGGVLLMIAGCVAVGAWFSWLALTSRTIWPAIVGHGALNASAAFYLLVSGDPQVDGALAGPLGVAGWIAFGVVGTVLLVVFRRKRRAADQV